MNILIVWVVVYRQREEQLLKDVMKKSAVSSVSSSDIESETNMVVARHRYERCIDGRKDKKGDIPNEKTKKVVEEIDPIQCELLIHDEDVGRRVVAKGELCKSEEGDLVHSVPLREDYVKVRILDVLDGELRITHRYLCHFSVMMYLGMK